MSDITITPTLTQPSDTYTLSIPDGTTVSSTTNSNSTITITITPTASHTYITAVNTTSLLSISCTGYYGTDQTDTTTFRPAITYGEVTLNSNGSCTFDITVAQTRSDFTYTNFIISLSNASNITTEISYQIVLPSNTSFTETSNTRYNGTDATKNIWSILANTGYEITDTPVLTISYLQNSSVHTATFDFTYDGTTETWSLDLTTTSIYNNVRLCRITATVEQLTKISTNYPLINVYKVSTSNLLELSQKRFLNTSDASSNPQYTDLGNYIISLVRYPFNLDADDDAQINLGFYNTEIDSKKVTTEETVEIDCGTMLINGTYKNQNDIPNARINVILKFFGTTTLDSKYINTSINIKYIVNVISNKCCIQISSNDNIVNCLNSKIGFDIPYILKTVTPNIYNTSSENESTKKTLPIKIIVEQNINETNLFNSKTEKTVNELAGYNELELLNYEFENATQNEIKEIQTQLSNGIYIQ